MAILVTGGAGFIGSHIVDLLLDNGYEVIVVDNLSTGKISNLNPKAVFYEIDIRSPELEKVFNNHKIEYVFHEAAQASVVVSMNAPMDDMSINIAGSVNLLSLSKKYNIKKFIAASTAAVYGMPEYLPVDEKHRTDLLSFYGLSKYTMENYIKTFGIDYIIFRYSNVYGPRQDCLGEAGVVAIFIDKLTKGLPVEIYGDGEQTRDFVFVEDVARANLMVLQSEIKNKLLNISTNNSISVNELFDIIKDSCNSSSEKIYKEERAGDIKHSRLDNSKIQELCGWENNYTVSEGLNKTVNWSKSMVK
jgi:UDP-glucose 4-epimerase